MADSAGAHAPAAAEEIIGGRYRLVSRVASGGMGEVWRAYDERLHRDVAVKRLLVTPGVSADEAETAARRAMREARIAARLQHAHAVGVFDVVDQDGRPCLVMEYVPSVSLQAVLAERGPLPVAQAVQVGSQLASALMAAHAAGIVHRDVKPGNVLIAEDGTVKLTDFGISRTLEDASLTRTGMLTGTPAYLAPEVARGGSATFASDIFSLGSTLYAAVEGHPPFGSAENPLAVLHAVAEASWRPPVRAGRLTGLLQRMLQADPERRPTAREVQRELTALEARTEDLGPLLPTVPVARPPEPAPQRPVDPTPQPSREPAASATAAEPPLSVWPEASADDQPRRRGALIVASAVLALLLVAGLIVWATTRSGGRTPTASAPTPSTSAAPATSAPPSPTPTSSAPASTPPTTSAAPTTSAPPSPAPAPPPAGTPTGAISSYYQLVPGDLQDGWNRMTANYQQNHVHGYDAYQEFWNAIGSVSASDVHSVGGSTVDATLTYNYKDGRRVVEVTQFGMVQDGGIWKIDSSSVLSSS